MEKILTIVIPTYNMQDYLRRCLDSLIVPEEQMKQLEVLVINDGSKDNSSAIAHEYQDKYPDTFRVIDKENGNYGSCVNRGLKEAKGKYIKILDADDWFDTEAFNQLIIKLHSVDVDVVLTNYDIINISDGNKEYVGLKELEYKGKYALDSEGVFKKISGFQMHAVTYNVKMLRDFGYMQTEGISYTDQEWIYYPMFYAKTLMCFDLCVYHYMIGREGQTMDPKVLEKSVPHTLIGTKSMLQYYKVYDKSTISADRRAYLEGKCIGRLRYLLRFYLLVSHSFTDMKTVSELSEIIAFSKNIKKKLLLTVISRSKPIPYFLYWKLFRKRLPSFLR